MSGDLHDVHSSIRMALCSTVMGIPAATRKGGAGGVPRVDVHIHDPGFSGRPSFTLLTDGMSDTRMPTADRFPDHPPRAELVMYTNNPSDEYVQWLFWVAGTPWREDRHLGNGDTVEVGRPLFAGSTLEHFILVSTVVRSDRELGEQLVVGGDGLDLLWVVPITDSEYQAVEREGADHLMAAFARNGHPVVLDEGRRSYL